MNFSFEGFGSHKLPVPSQSRDKRPPCIQAQLLHPVKHVHLKLEVRGKDDPNLAVCSAM